MLKTTDVEFKYNNNQRFSFPNIDCESGDQALILGQSGCGKTTLLHLIGGLLRPESGTIVVNNTDLVILNDDSLDKFRGQNIGIIFQKSHLIKALTVEENLLTAQYLAGKTQSKEKVRSILKKLGIDHKLSAKPHKLSLGEQQRVSIARALVNDPTLILADEPTSSLDDVNCERVAKLLLEASKELGATLLIVTHDSRLKAYVSKHILLEPINNPL